MLWNRHTVERQLGPPHLGPDALELDADRLRERLEKRRTPIKVALLDQSVLAGVGNLYASEILHVARNPPSKTLRSNYTQPMAARGRQHVARAAGGDSVRGVHLVGRHLSHRSKQSRRLSELSSSLRSRWGTVRCLPQSGHPTYRAGSACDLLLSRLSTTERSPGQAVAGAVTRL